MDNQTEIRQALAGAVVALEQASRLMSSTMGAPEMSSIVTAWENLQAVRVTVGRWYAVVAFPEDYDERGPGELPIPCMVCGCPTSSHDGVATVTGDALCGSATGNGCADRAELAYLVDA
jgi:hypothetical protein